jgi:hypothetical protein
MVEDLKLARVFAAGHTILPFAFHHMDYDRKSEKFLFITKEGEPRTTHPLDHWL